MTTSLPSAVKAAAEEIACRVSLAGQHAEVYSEIISRHVEPIVRAAEAERDEARKDEIRIAHSLTAQLDQALAKLAEVEKERDKLREHHSFYESIQRSQQSHQSLCWRVANAAIKSRAVYNFGACGGGEPSFGAIVSKIEEAVANCDKVAVERDSALTRADSAEALLREARSGVEAIAQHHEARSRGDDRAEQQAEKWRYLIRDIDKHLANRGTP